MTTRKIQGHLEAIHGVEASPGLISAITGAVTGAITGAIMEEVTARPAPLDPCYPIVFMGAIEVDIRTGGRGVPGPWFHAHEGARFRARVPSDLRNPIVGKQSPGSFPDPPHTFQRSRSPSWTG
jgi:putative transposase